MKTKNSKWKNAQIANDALTAAHDAYINDPIAKKYRKSLHRFADYVEKLDGLLIRLTHHLNNLNTALAKDNKEDAKAERVNIKSLKWELSLLFAFRTDWNEQYGITEEHIRLLTGE